jgi:hypothetical protein
MSNTGNAKRKPPSAYLPQLPPAVIDDSRKFPLLLDDFDDIKQALGGQWESKLQKTYFRKLLQISTLNPDEACEAMPRGLRVTQAMIAKWLASLTMRQTLDAILLRRFHSLGVNEAEVQRYIRRGLAMAAGDEDQRVMTQFKGEARMTKMKRTDLAALARFTDQVSKQLGMYQDEQRETPAISINFDLGNGDATTINTAPESAQPAGSNGHAAPPLEHQSAHHDDAPPIRGAELLDSLGMVDHITGEVADTPDSERLSQHEAEALLDELLGGSS